MNGTKALPDGWNWASVIVVAVMAIMMLIGTAYGMRNDRYFDSGDEEASALLSSRQARAAAIQDPMVRLQSLGYVNQLKKCMSGKSGVLQTSSVSRSMEVVAREQPLFGLDREAVTDAIKSVEERCNGALIAELAVADPVGAHALAAELKEQGLYLPQQVVADAIKNRSALADLRQLAF